MNPKSHLEAAWLVNGCGGARNSAAVWNSNLIPCSNIHFHQFSEFFIFYILMRLFLAAVAALYRTMSVSWSDLSLEYQCFHIKYQIMQMASCNSNHADCIMQIKSCRLHHENHIIQFES